MKTSPTQSSPADSLEVDLFRCMRDSSEQERQEKIQILNRFAFKQSDEVIRRNHAPDAPTF